MSQSVMISLETSTETMSVALALFDAGADEAVSPYWSVNAYRETTGAASSSALLPAVRALLDASGASLADCVAIAFGAGPGSFTGLRTATGAAQGLAFGLGVPVVPVSTFAACAESARSRDAATGCVLAALDARMDEVYWARCDWDEATRDWRVSPARLDAPEEVAAPDRPFVLAGNAAAVFGARLRAAAHATRIDALAMPDATHVARLGHAMWRRGEALAPEAAAPQYVRNKVAQTTAERPTAERAAARASGATARRA
jgi:tRNA threonylcarbamoyladenosine biosynthesis protein TsaB